MMNHKSVSFSCRIRVPLTLAAVLALLVCGVLSAGYSPPRVSFIEGKAAYEPAGDIDWSEVTINLPLLSGDRIISQDDSRIEIEVGDSNFLRLGGETDLTFGTLAGNEGDFEMQLGDVVLRVNDSSRYYVQVPGASVEIRKKGLYRLSVSSQGESRIVVWKGRADVTGLHGSEKVESGEQMVIGGPGASTQSVSAVGPYDDDLRLWSDRRDASFVGSVSVSRVGGTTYAGVYDLDRYGSWDYVSGYGNCWFPSVGAGWAPYRAGRWSRYPTYGWTWISAEPWGWLPYHYGSWNYYPSYGRWGWLPGSFSYWSPSLVNFYFGGGYVGWSPRGYGYRGYRGHGNSVHIVNNNTIINNYNEPGSGLTVVSEDDFRRSRPDRSRLKNIDRSLAGSLKSGLPSRLSQGALTGRPRGPVTAGSGRGVDVQRVRRGTEAATRGGGSGGRSAVLGAKSASTGRVPAGARQVTSNTPARSSTGPSRTSPSRRSVVAESGSRRGRELGKNRSVSGAGSVREASSERPRRTTVGSYTRGLPSRSVSGTGRRTSNSYESRPTRSGSLGRSTPSRTGSYKAQTPSRSGVSRTGSRSTVTRPSRSSTYSRRPSYSRSSSSGTSGRFSRPSSSRPSRSISRPSSSRPSRSISRPSSSRPSRSISRPSSSRPSRSVSRPSTPSRSSRPSGAGSRPVRRPR